MAARRNAIDRGEAGLERPGLFTHRLSFDEDLVSLLPTDAGRLRAATFLDGREDFAAGTAVLAPMDAILHGDPPGLAPRRFIFHVGFCGSTLLSRLLDDPGRSLVLREPQALADLAARRAMLDQSGSEDPRVDGMIARLPGLLSRPWNDGEEVAIKPSNWANNLAPALCSAAAPVLPLFLTASPRAYLQAVFRGGDARIGFAARAAVHFSATGQANAEQVARALAGDAEQPVKLARLAALALRMQAGFFAEAAAGDRLIDFEALSTAPVETAIRAAELLELDLPPDVIAANASRWLPRDAKRPSADYSAEIRRSVDRRVDETFGAVIDEALAWAEDV